MATHSSILAWRIPWTEECGRLQFIGLQWVGHDWSDLTQHSTHCFGFIFVDLSLLISFVFFSCGLMTIFKVAIAFFFSFFVSKSIIDFWFALTMRICYNSLCLCVYTRVAFSSLTERWPVVPPLSGSSRPQICLLANRAPSEFYVGPWDLLLFETRWKLIIPHSRHFLSLEYICLPDTI